MSEKSSFTVIDCAMGLFVLLCAGLLVASVPYAVAGVLLAYGLLFVVMAAMGQLAQK